MNLCFLDVETTGLNAISDSICEIAVVKFTCDKEYVNSFVRIVKPRTPIPYKLTMIHGLSDSIVANAEYFSAIADEFLSFIGEDIVIGYNIGFDLGFINNELKLCGRRELCNYSVDVLKMARKFLSLPKYKLSYVAKHLGFEDRGYHWAETDAMATAFIFFKILEKMHLSAKEFIESTSIKRGRR